MKKIISFMLSVILLISAVPAYAAGGQYSIGEKSEDFSVTLSDGSEISLSSLLSEYDAVFLNFFFIGCQWCDREFPFLEKAYEKYSDQIAVLSVSPYDTAEDVAAYKEQNGLSFLMGCCKYGSLEQSFGVQGFPTSFMIDREGIICLKESTTLSAFVFERIFETFSAEDYTSPAFEVSSGFRSAADSGCPVFLEGEDISVAITSEGDNLSASFRRIVFDKLPDAYKNLANINYYIVPELKGDLTVLVGPDVNINAVKLESSNTAGYRSFLLPDMETNDKGFFCPIELFEDNYMEEVILTYGSKSSIYFYILEAYPYDEDFRSAGIEYHVEGEEV